MIPPSGEQYELRLGAQRVVIVEVGGGIRAWDGVLDGYGEDEMCPSGRGAVLAPWPNRLTEGRYTFDGEERQLPLTEPASGSAIHGLVRWAGWRAIERTEAAVLMEHVIHPQSGYPWTLRLRVEYRLKSSGLAVTSTAQNLSDRVCPFGIGHHPYIAAPTGLVDDMTLQGKPIGAKRFDDTLALEGPWRIEAGDVTVWADEAWKYVQLFTGDDKPDVARRALAIEPMTCPPNAFRTGEDLIRLEPGEMFIGRWGIATG